MQQIQFLVPEAYDGVSVRGFLRGPCRVSARLLATCKRLPGGITVAGAARIATDHLHAGEILTLRLPVEQDTLPISPNGAPPLDVLYADDAMVAVNKPAGMILYARAGQLTGTLRDVALDYFRAHQEPLVFHPLYRLDRDTTGVVLLARDRYAASAVPETVQKVYGAVCEGTFSGSGTITKPIGPEPGSKVRQCVRADGRPAVTHWRALASAKGHTLVVCQLETGRTHQIRVHMASCGHPLAGDDFYGGSREWIARQALHCGWAAFRSPDAGPVTVEVPLPEDFQNLLVSLQLPTPHFQAEAQRWQTEDKAQK